MPAGEGNGIVRTLLSGRILPILLLGLAGCGRGDEASLGMLRNAMTEVKTSAEAVLAGRPPLTRPGLAGLLRQIGTADRSIDGTLQIATALGEASTVRAAALDYLAAVRGAVDQTRDRYSTAIALDEAKAQDRTVSASIAQAGDEATLERASSEANAKAAALDAAINKSGDAIVERERRLGILVTALQRDTLPLTGYDLVSHEAVAAAMASNVSAGH